MNEIDTISVAMNMYNDGYNKGREDAFNEIMPILIDIVDTECCCYGYAEKIDELERQWIQLKEQK